MRSYTAKIVLLIAVLASQIVGGSSCCCLPRLLASTLNSALSSAVSRNIPAREYACPKCCQHSAESSQGISTDDVSKIPDGQAGFSGSDRCTCVRDLFAGSPEETPNGSLIDRRGSTQYNAYLELGNLSLLLAIQKDVKCSYSPPRCHWQANRDWQCIACIWIA